MYNSAYQLFTVLKLCLLFPYTQLYNAWCKAEAFISPKKQIALGG